MAISNAAYGEVVSAVAEERYKTDRDNVIRRHPILEALKPRMSDLSGTVFTVPIVGAENTLSAQITDRKGTIVATGEGDLATTARYVAKSPVVGSFQVPWKDLQDVAGKNNIIDLANLHMDQAVKGQRKALAVAFYDPAATYYESLASIVSTTAIVGGIDPSVAGNANWAGQVTTASSKAATSIQKAFRAKINDIKNFTTSEVDLVICGRAVFEEYQDSFEQYQRYPDPGNTRVDGQHADIYHNGLLVRWDQDCSASDAYFLCTESWFIKTINGNFLKKQPARQVPAAATTNATMTDLYPISTYLLVATNERRAQGKLTRVA